MDEQVLKLFGEFNAKLANLFPKSAGPITARDPKKVADLRMMVSGFASNLMFFGMLRNNDVSLRAGNYFSNIAMDPVKWEEFVNVIYGPA